ncbi:MAG: response regulator transcription factor [Acidimicrobiales bacterium]
MVDEQRSRPTSIVLADDDHRFRTLVVSILTDDGYTVVAEANDAASAREAAKRHRPDVVVLDLVMHGSEGLSTLREILEDNPAQSVLVISSLFDQAIEREAVALGGWYLEKAEGVAALEQAIDRIADGSHNLA